MWSFKAALSEASGLGVRAMFFSIQNMAGL
jgi:hypothetical protein